MNKRSIVAMLLVVAALVVAALVVAAVGLAAIPPGTADAGTGPGGYAAAAQKALQKAGAPFGYKVTCAAVYSDYALATVRVVCKMTERP